MKKKEDLDFSKSYITHPILPYTGEEVYFQELNENGEFDEEKTKQAYLNYLKA